MFQRQERGPEWLDRGLSPTNFQGEPSTVKRETYHVTADGEGGCRVKAEGGARAASTHRNKANAVQNDKDLAKAQPQPSGQIVIHGRDGEIHAEHTYGKDSHPPKG
jgi:hypothetical protein